jgi:hypothetical protein
LRIGPVLPATACVFDLRRPPMKMVLAMIRPHKLDDIKAGLSEIGVQGMSVTEIRVTVERMGKRRRIAARLTRWSSFRRLELR